MFPYTCQKGTEHSFDSKPGGSDEYVCSSCGIDYNTFSAEDKKRTELISKIDVLIKFTNGGDTHVFAEAMFQAMQKTHPTLQQNFIRGMMAFIVKMQDMPTDLRNAASVEWCKEVSKNETYLPLI